MYIAEPLRSLALPIDSLSPDPANARVHDEKNIQAIVASLNRFGQRAPIVVQKQGMVVRAGNGRLLAAKKLGWQYIAAVVVDETSVDATAFAIADNRTAELASWDDETLASLLQSLPEDARDAAGFDEGDIGELLDRLTPDEVVEDEAPEPLPDPVSKTGDLWLLGDHRLLCGDSTKPDDWARLAICDGCVCFTSPPYNLGKSASLRGNGAIGQRGNAYGKHDDNMSDDGYGALIASMLANAMDHCKAAVFNVQPVAGCKRVLLRWLSDNAERLVDVITWDKGHAAPQMAEGVLANRFEWLVVFGEPGASRKIPYSSWKGTMQSVYAAPPQRNNEFADVHGATFPVHLPMYVVGDLMNRARAVVDCCMGTGTTIIAAEQLGKSAYGIDLDPTYVDVAVRRWEKLTGKQATLESTGKTWRETAAERGVHVE